MSLSQNACSTEDPGFQINHLQSTQVESERRNPTKRYTDRVFAERQQSASNTQPPPLIKTDVTQTDRIWLRDTTPPNPATRETPSSWPNNSLGFSGLDSTMYSGGLDSSGYSGWRESSSFSSDTDSVSSQDTIILMTSEEMAKNDEKVTESSRQYEEAKHNHLMTGMLNFSTSSSMGEDNSVYSTENTAITTTNQIPVSDDTKPTTSSIVLPKSGMSSPDKIVTQADKVNKSKLADGSAAERLQRNTSSLSNHQSSKADEDMDDGYDSSDAMGSDTSNSSASVPSPNGASASGGVSPPKDEPVSPEQASADLDGESAHSSPTGDRLESNIRKGDNIPGTQQQDNGLRTDLDYLHKTVPTFRQMNASLRRDAFRNTMDRKGKIPLENNVRNMTYGLTAQPEVTSEANTEVTLYNSGINETDTNKSETESGECLDTDVRSRRPSSPTEGVYNISSQTQAKWAGRNQQSSSQSGQASGNTDTPPETPMNTTINTSAPSENFQNTTTSNALQPKSNGMVSSEKMNTVLKEPKVSHDETEQEKRKALESACAAVAPKERKTLITFNDTVEVFYEDRDRKRTGFHKLLNRLNKGPPKHNEGTDGGSRPALVGILKKGNKKITIPNKEGETRTGENNISNSIPNKNYNELNILFSNQQNASSAKTNPSKVNEVDERNEPLGDSVQNTTVQIDTSHAQITTMEYNDAYAERLANNTNRTAADNVAHDDKPQIKILPAYRDNNLPNKGVLAVEHSSQTIKASTNNAPSVLPKDQIIRSKPSRQAIKEPKQINEQLPSHTNNKSDENSRNVEIPKLVRFDTNDQTNKRTADDTTTNNDSVQDNINIQYIENEKHRGNIIIPQRKVYTTADRPKKADVTAAHEKNLSDAIRMIINPPLNADETPTADSLATKKMMIASSEESLSSSGSSNYLSDTKKLTGAKSTVDTNQITKSSELYEQTAWNIVTGNKPHVSTEVLNDGKHQGQYRAGDSGPIDPQGQYRKVESGPIEPQGQYRKGESGPIEQQGQYRKGESGPIEPLGQYRKGDSGPIEPQGQYRKGESGPIDPQSQYGKGESGPIDPQGQYRKGDSGPIELQGQYKKEKSTD